MPVRLIANRRGSRGPEVTDPVTVETTVNGQTFAWGPGQTRSFGDSGVGVAHAAFDGEEATVQEDNTANTLGPAESVGNRSQEGELNMPWKVGKKTKKGYPIKKKSGKTVGYSKTKKKAQASVRARYANYRG